MKFGFFVFILVFVLRAIPAPAFELSKPQREEHGLNIELESSESPAQPVSTNTFGNLRPRRKGMRSLASPSSRKMR